MRAACSPELAELHSLQYARFFLAFGEEGVGGSQSSIR